MGFQHQMGSHALLPGLAVQGPFLVHSTTLLPEGV